MPAPDGQGSADWQELALRWERGRKLLWDSTSSVSERMHKPMPPRCRTSSRNCSCSGRKVSPGRFTSIARKLPNVTRSPSSCTVCGTMPRMSETPRRPWKVRYTFLAGS